MVLEQMLKMPVKLFEGSYENIKITTPEDLDIAKMFLLNVADRDEIRIKEALQAVFNYGKVQGYKKIKKYEKRY